jgi:metallophosphoesterase (TIGR00282 family)
LKILFIGDIVGRPGRTIIYEKLKDFKIRNDIHITIANVENLSSGFGITEKNLKSLYEAGVDYCTSGNHVWDNREVFQFIEEEKRLLRPANYPATCPGRGSAVYSVQSCGKIGIMNLSGRTFMPPLDNPFPLADKLIEEIKSQTNIIILDFHCEATSEKVAMGYYLDGRITAVLGTHTHIQTADERILSAGTAFICDVGMTGGQDSILGVEKDAVLSRFTTLMPSRLTPAWGDIRMSYVIVEADEKTGLAKSIQRGQLKKDL